MATRSMRFVLSALLSVVSATLFVDSARAESAGTVNGTILGPDGKPMAAVLVLLRNNITGFRAETTTGRDGTFRFFNVPFNPYELHIDTQGFSPVHQAVDVRTAIR